MPRVPRVIDYVGDMLDEIRLRLGPKADTNEGSRWDAIAGMLGQGFVRANRLQIDAFDAHVLGLAKGADLDTYVATHGPLRRFPPRASTGACAFLRATSAFGATSIPKDKTFRVPFRGKSVTFRVTEDVSVKSTALAGVARIECLTPGTGGNVGEVNAGMSMIDALDDVTLKPTILVVAGGCDQETDDELTIRQTNYEQGRERATKPAIAYAALSVNGVKHAILAARDDDRRGAQGVCYVGDRDWQASQTMIEDVAVAIETYRGMKSITVLGIQSQDVTIEGTIVMARPITRYNVAAIRAAAVARIIEYFDNRATPFEYQISSIQGRIERAHDEIVTATLSLPAASVANPLTPSALALYGFPDALQRYRTNESLITLDIRGPE